jgi:hypothetical protein
MRQLVSFSIGLVILIGVVGCGPKRSRSGVVTGKVTYGGKAVNGAALLLYPSSGEAKDPITIPVTQEGEYRITDMPLGKYKVVVQGTEGATQASPTYIPPEKLAEVKERLAKMNTPATIPFPDKYKDPELTDLECTITEKPQTLNLELKD